MWFDLMRSLGPPNTEVLDTAQNTLELLLKVKTKWWEHTHPLWLSENWARILHHGWPGAYTYLSVFPLKVPSPLYTAKKLFCDWLLNMGLCANYQMCKFLPQSDASVSRVSNCGKWRHSQFSHPPSTLRHMEFQFPYVLLENPKPCICALIKSSSFPALQCLPPSSHCFPLSRPHAFGILIVHWVLLLLSAYMIIYLLEQGWPLSGCIPNENRLSPVHQSSPAFQLGVGHHEPFSPFHAGSLSGLILCRSRAGSSRFRELIYSTALLCPHEIVWL